MNPTFEDEWAQVVADLNADAVVVSTEASPTRSSRRLRLTPAADIQVRPVRWLWQDRIALGTLALLGGREGIGKSTLAYQLAASLTRGRQEGVHRGRPRAVIVAATEDSWEHTIVPRLIAADADLDLIYRADVQTQEGHESGLSLPKDLDSLGQAVDEVGAALILLDPLMSRLDAKLDTHKDAEVRQALEPLVRLADTSGAAVLGLIHVNKSLSTDPLTMLMGSRAFAAVARAVLFCMIDPDDESARLLGQPKNNLGRTDLPTLVFRIGSAVVAHTEQGPVCTGKIAWEGESTRTLSDALEGASVVSDHRSATQDAADWLIEWLTARGGSDDSASIKRQGANAGHSPDALKRARRRVGAISASHGYPRRTYWRLPEANPASPPPEESSPTALTAPNAPTGGESVQSAQLVQSESGWSDPQVG